MTNQYESAIEQSEARIKEIQEGAKRCRDKGAFFHGAWTNIFWVAILMAAGFGALAVIIHWAILLLTGVFLCMAWLASTQAPKAINDFEELAQEWEEMEEGERDYLASLQTSLREWRGY